MSAHGYHSPHTTAAPAPVGFEKKVNLFKHTRLSCPNCSHTTTIIKAFTGDKKNLTEHLKYDDTDFTCPDCKKDLVLCRAVYGGFYFSMAVKKLDFSK